MKIILGIMWLLHWLPLPILGRLGDALGALLFATALPSRRRITLTNLRLCLPHLSEAERIRMARQHFQAYARAILERSILWWASEARLNRLILVEPCVPMDMIKAGPVIFLCPHFVNLEAAGAAIAMKTSACSIYQQQHNRAFDDALRKGRSRFRPVELFSRFVGIKPVIRALRKGLPFFMLPDMDFGEKDAEFVPFFGIPAATLTAPARLAASTGAKIIPVIATALPNYRGWKVTFYPAWENYPGDDIIAATRSVNAFIEARILEAPSEYWWAHKRFKTRPPGESNLYASTPK